MTPPASARYRPDLAHGRQADLDVPRVLARQEARRLGHNRPDCCPAHILRGLIGEGQGEG
jgi:hypothetical protein